MFNKLYIIKGECWIWGAGYYKNGYGCYEQEYAHRYSYKKYIGKIPQGYHIHHLCKTRACVNPKHLQAVTKSEHHLVHFGYKVFCKKGHKFDKKNTLWSKRGQRCRACHRNDEKKRRYEKVTKPLIKRIHMIRKEFNKGISKKDIANKYGISWYTVHRYITGVSYKDY